MSAFPLPGAVIMVTGRTWVVQEVYPPTPEQRRSNYRLLRIRRFHGGRDYLVGCFADKNGWRFTRPVPAVPALG